MIRGLSDGRGWELLTSLPCPYQMGPPVQGYQGFCLWGYGAIPQLPSMPSWHGAQLKHKVGGLLKFSTSIQLWFVVDNVDY